MWATLMVSLVVAAPPAKAEAEKDRDVKIAARGVWAVQEAKPTHRVIRSAEELALAHGIDAKHAKELRMQAAAQKDVTDLLKVKGIDWSKQMLVVVAAGAKPTGGYRVEIVTAAVKDKKLTVRWKLNSPAADAVVTTVVTHPAQMALVERFDGSIQFDPPLKGK